MEEPVCEPQAVALYYVSRLARKHVKVLISGEGGDEAFAGYQTYRGVLWLERLKTALGPFAGMAGRGAAYLDRALEFDRCTSMLLCSVLPSTTTTTVEPMLPGHTSTRNFPNYIREISLVV